MPNPTPSKESEAMTNRPPTSDDAEWILAQEREVQELRRKQLDRDGRIFDSILGEVVESENA